MRIICSISLFLLTFCGITAQVKYENFTSSILGEDRQLKIQLPRGYESNEDNAIPLDCHIGGLVVLASGNHEGCKYDRLLAL